MPAHDTSDAQLLTEVDNSHKLTRPLILMRVSLFIDPGTYVPDLLTRVRILETVASVSQDREYFSYKNPEARPIEASLASSLPDRVEVKKDVTATSGRDVVNAVIRYLPKSVTVGEAIKELADRIRTVPGVRTIRFDELNGRPLTVGGKPVVF
jgi:hypothetical protein